MLLAYINHPARKILDEARWAAENGFDALDLTIEGPAALIDSFDPAELRALLDAAGMRVVGHTAWYLPFASPVERVRRAAVEEIAASLPVFAALGATMVNVHMTRGVPLYGDDDELQRNGASFAELAHLAEPYGIQIIVEHPPWRRFGLKQIRAILDADPRLGFHLDVGHAFVAGIDLERLLDELGDRLRHVHFSDNRGQDDDHMPIGAGKIDWQQTIRLLKRAGYDGIVTLEVFDQERDFLLLSAQKVRSWWRTLE
ncbi:MAG: sugar phosphate isomerase/epimerase [Roseiflexaceae bacterium]|nr:sugar phosphate isomerase/epimerase [Roseiflexaceae bacterium]